SGDASRAADQTTRADAHDARHADDHAARHAEEHAAHHADPSPRATDIKYGPGGMLDVYFAVRYLQLRDGVPDREDSRSTRATLARLRDAGSIGEEDFRALCEGYALLRELDHGLRLVAGRSTRLPSAQDHTLLADLARRAGYPSAAALTSELAARMSAVREAYERITADE
ncbi:MAG: hypothetical protein M3379_17580, partial [Acidobacteriota bacterium]|nr:hypothetical protein [Acidobacteriota bacterium]